MTTKLPNSLLLPLIFIGIGGVAFIMYTLLDSDIPGYTFSVRNLERFCEIHTDDRRTGRFECEREDMKVVEKKCEAFFEGAAEVDISIRCRDQPLRVLEQCGVTMMAVKMGYLDCP